MSYAWTMALHLCGGKNLTFPRIVYSDLDIKPIKGILEKFDGSLVRKLSPGYTILTKLIREVLNFETFKDKMLG